MSETTHKVIMNFPDYTRLFIVEELLQENELPVQHVKDYFSMFHHLPTLTFTIEESDINQVCDFMQHAKTINLASRYKIFPSQCQGAN